MDVARVLSVTFVRGARRVTGSNFLVEAKTPPRPIRFLIDCGLTQGERFCESVNRNAFPYDPASLDAIFFTHAHVDHIGLFPKLVKEGFRGKAYATPPTRALMPVMLEDSLSIMVDEAKRCGEEAPYTREDVAQATALVKELSYQQKLQLGEGVSVVLVDAGHIIGSASVVIEAFGTRSVFTGDLGRTPALLIPDRETPKDVDYLCIESVYGDRVHEQFEASEATLREAVEDVRKKKAVLLIPAFSLERTQIILSALDRMFAQGLPSVPVFLDSPLAARVTEVYRRFPEYLRDDVRARIQSGEDLFSFPNLRVTADAKESREVDTVPPPKIIIAGAGMSHGGRIRRHEARYLSDPKTIVLFSGYQAAGSLGRRIKDGAREVDIDGAHVPVRATMRSVDGFSAHADRDDLLRYVEEAKPKRVFVILGETRSSAFLAQRIGGFLDIPVSVPREGETVSFDVH